MINSQINILAQARSYLHAVTNEQYQEVVPPFMSASGEHLRHILDHYLSVVNGLESGLVDYDKRNRGGLIEKETQAALALISDIETFLFSLTPATLKLSLKLSTEISIEEKHVEIVGTTLARELIFVGSHAVHHFAMIEQISKAQKIETPGAFGLAPATATFIREKKCAR